MSITDTALRVQDSPTSSGGATDVVLDIRELSVRFGARTVVDRVDLTARRGEVVALVGESGSGKSMTARSVLGLLPEGAEARGSIVLGGTEIVGAGERELHAVRGTRAAMVFQEPQTALNPVQKIGTQIGQALRAHGPISRSYARTRAVELLGMVGIPDPERRSGWYPHQLSGGQKQRVVIALALSGEPDLLIADEPTTALDVTVQAEILALLRELQRRNGTTILFITHNLGVVAEIADRVVVLRDGRVIEERPVRELFATPREDYTRTLLASVPRLPEAGSVAVRDSIPARHFPDRIADAVDSEAREGSQPAQRLPDPVTGVDGSALPGRSKSPQPLPDSVPLLPVHGGDVGGAEVAEGSSPVRSPDLGAAVSGSAAQDSKPVLRLVDLSVEYRSRGRRFRALHDVSLSVASGEVIGLVGESGSGKSTLGRAALGLVPAHGGEVVLHGTSLSGLSGRELRAVRKNVALVHQDVAASLDPRRTLEESIGEPLLVHRVASGTVLRAKVAQLLESVRLPTDYARRRPGELSGGQRQRVALARALALAPRLLVADEPTSALDVSVQSQVLDLFADLRTEYNFACLFISHDLAVVHRVADRVVVLRDGAIIETGTPAQVFSTPHAEYTRRLLESVPVPDPDRTRREPSFRAG